LILKEIANIFSRESCTLSEFFDEKFYPFSKATKRRSDLDSYTFNKHIRPHFGSRCLRSIMPEEIDEWKLIQIEQGYKPASINKHSSMLRRIFSIANKWGYIDRNPFTGLAIKDLDVGDFVQRFLTKEEIYRIISEAKRSSHPFIYFLVILLILTGARKSEWRLARWKDVNYITKELVVPISKNGRSRKVILSAEAIEVLHDLKKHCEALGLSTRLDNWIFCNPKTLRPYTCFFHSFNKIRIAADLPTVRIHDLRHTFASLLVNNGASIYEVQKLLGHHHISMTERYAHLFPDTLSNRVEIIAKVVLIKH